MVPLLLYIPHKLGGAEPKPLIVSRSSSPLNLRPPTVKEARAPFNFLLVLAKTVSKVRRAFAAASCPAISNLREAHGSRDAGTTGRWMRLRKTTNFGADLGWQRLAPCNLEMKIYNDSRSGHFPSRERITGCDQPQLNSPLSDPSMLRGQRGVAKKKKANSVG